MRHGGGGEVRDQLRPGVQDRDRHQVRGGLREEVRHRVQGPVQVSEDQGALNEY